MRRAREPIQDAIILYETEDISYYSARGNQPKLHSHEWIELAYLYHGTLMHSVGGLNYKINEGEYFIVEYGQPHDYVVLNEGPIRLMNIMFHPRFIDPMLVNARSLSEIYNHYLIHFNEKQLTMTPTLIKFGDPSGAIGNYVNEIVREIQEKRFGWRESVRGILINIIIKTLRSIAYDDSSDEEKAFSRRINEFVSMNYMHPIKVSDAFGGAGQYSTPYMSKRFKQETGITFSEHLKKVRIDASQRLLINTNKSVAEISELVGYVDTTFFHNTFRSIVGCSPLEYRKSQLLENLALAEAGEKENANAADIANVNSARGTEG